VGAGLSGAVLGELPNDNIKTKTNAKNLRRGEFTGVEGNTNRLSNAKDISRNTMTESVFNRMILQTKGKNKWDYFQAKRL
jgi:hypothetical protein